MPELSAYSAISTKEITMAKNIVLVHGGFVDGAGWEGVYKILKRDGYSVSVVQNPTISLEDDVAVTKRILATQDGPAILVGHSYGGAVITEAGNHPKVSALVYRSEEHTSELQSQSNLVCRLLLEKKKKNTTKSHESHD